MANKWADSKAAVLASSLSGTWNALKCMGDLTPALYKKVSVSHGATAPSFSGSADSAVSLRTTFCCTMLILLGSHAAVFTRGQTASKNRERTSSLFGILAVDCSTVGYNCKLVGSSTPSSHKSFASDGAMSGPRRSRSRMSSEVPSWWSGTRAALTGSHTVAYLNICWHIVHSSRCSLVSWSSSALPAGSALCALDQMNLSCKAEIARCILRCVLRAACAVFRPTPGMLGR
mmetsp:Transcript_57462/g.131948  ORF Transcript_57462/g.131948 Transcript_57462/m.131948 type:complete len:231 (-) Transcript_57462:889-1581(-)